MRFIPVIGGLSLCLLPGFVLASPTPSPLDGYDIFIPSWEVQVTPGSEPVILNGTIDEVHAELLKLNPKWDDDFPGVDVDESSSLANRDLEWSLEKRTDFTESKYNCFGRWGRAHAITVRQGISYLRKVTGRPHAAAGPGTCGRVSCSYDSAIYWCNDDKNSKTPNSYGSIADGAQYLLAKCRLGSGISEWTAGQVFHKTHWNVIVREDKC
ncbi:uncharacterized protein BDV14DRAFT_202586 [Aspergillus stella-maris]|uniref:uncharacterized protein n=1 Tax=Aspergillus stella-maris TaxID=1810926 RepID=UPI003CCDF76D